MEQIRNNAPSTLPWIRNEMKVKQHCGKRIAREPYTRVNIVEKKLCFGSALLLYGSVLGAQIETPAASRGPC